MQYAVNINVIAALASIVDNNIHVRVLEASYDLKFVDVRWWYWRASAWHLMLLLMFMFKHWPTLFFTLSVSVAYATEWMIRRRGGGDVRRQLKFWQKNHRLFILLNLDDVQCYNIGFLLIIHAVTSAFQVPSGNQTINSHLQHRFVNRWAKDRPGNAIQIKVRSLPGTYCRTSLARVVCNARTATARVYFQFVMTCFDERYYRWCPSSAFL